MEDLFTEEGLQRIIDQLDMAKLNAIRNGDPEVREVRSSPSGLLDTWFMHVPCDIHNS